MFPLWEKKVVASRQKAGVAAGIKLLLVGGTSDPAKNPPQQARGAEGRPPREPGEGGFGCRISSFVHIRTWVAAS